MTFKIEKKATNINVAFSSSAYQASKFQQKLQPLHHKSTEEKRIGGKIIQDQHMSKRKRIRWQPLSLKIFLHRAQKMHGSCNAAGEEGPWEDCHVSNATCSFSTLPVEVGAEVLAACLA